MRITYRDKSNGKYWNNRWENILPDKISSNEKEYPIKYSNLLIKSKGKILEAGCGPGRVLRYYHKKGFDIYGVDFVESIILKLKNEDATLKVSAQNILNLDFGNEFFDYVLAFGLYHNFNQNLNKAIIETKRVLKKDGCICASFRSDNWQTRIADWLYLKKNPIRFSKFHKLNLKKKEFINLFEKHGFEILKFFSVENMSLLYKFRFFRANSHKIFNENKCRSEGYKLSFLGNLIQKISQKFFSDQLCNIYVIIAKKN